MKSRIRYGIVQLIGNNQMLYYNTKMSLVLSAKHPSVDDVNSMNLANLVNSIMAPLLFRPTALVLTRTNFFPLEMH